MSSNAIFSFEIIITYNWFEIIYFKTNLKEFLGCSGKVPPLFGVEQKRFLQMDTLGKGCTSEPSSCRHYRSKRIHAQDLKSRSGGKEQQSANRYSGGDPGGKKKKRQIRIKWSVPQRFVKSRSRRSYPAFPHTTFVFGGDWGRASTSMKLTDSAQAEIRSFRKVGTALHCLPVSQLPFSYPSYPRSPKRKERSSRHGSCAHFVIPYNTVPGRSRVRDTFHFRQKAVRRVCLAGSQHRHGTRRSHHRTCRRTDDD